jgi:hypothetical protein
MKTFFCYNQTHSIFSYNSHRHDILIICVSYLYIFLSYESNELVVLCFCFAPPALSGHKPFDSLLLE